SNIIESEDGYLILYCVDDYNEDATLAKKEEIIDDRQMNLFEELFETWQKDVKIELNKDVWDEITFD
ncbi:MAG: peptidyl-prolyl cis-trans isomerase, partial [Clostridiales bacterium]|nr:peptidyl-prolyl cis-trans isomerase [Clostridiales bacterium]